MDKTAIKEKTVEWKTAVTKIEPNKVMIRGYAINELMGNISYADGLYLLLKGELPPTNFGKMMDAILVSSLDHGVTPPSVLAALTSASTGAGLNQALACGLLSVNKFHGGAIEDCQNILHEAAAIMKEQNLDYDGAAKQLVQEYLEKKKVLSGFGHRVHTNDPRTAKLIEMAKELNFYGEYLKTLEAIERAFARAKGKTLPINVDGAIAGVLCEMGFPPELGNAFFMIARMPGLLAHIVEEKQRQKPMRRINPNEYEYDGQEYRPIPEDFRS